jgi:hypothetical protein
MDKKIPSALLTFSLGAALLLNGCAAPLPSSLPDDQVLQVVDSILMAFNAGDYASATKNMSAVMVKAFSETQFLNMADLLKKTSGNYISCDGALIELSNNTGYAVYRLPCKFELETVTVAVAFFIASREIEGLYFDSVTLRSTPFP